VSKSRRGRPPAYPRPRHEKTPLFRARTTLRCPRAGRRKDRRSSAATARNGALDSSELASVESSSNHQGPVIIPGLGCACRSDPGAKLVGRPRHYLILTPPRDFGSRGQTRPASWVCAVFVSPAARSATRFIPDRGRPRALSRPQTSRTAPITASAEDWDHVPGAHQLRYAMVRKTRSPEFRLHRQPRGRFRLAWSGVGLPGQLAKLLPRHRVSPPVSHDGRPVTQVRRPPRSRRVSSMAAPSSSESGASTGPLGHP